MVFGIRECKSCKAVKEAAESQHTEYINARYKLQQELDALNSGFVQEQKATNNKLAALEKAVQQLQTNMAATSEALHKDFATIKGNAGTLQKSVEAIQKLHGELLEAVGEMQTSLSQVMSEADEDDY